MRRIAALATVAAFALVGCTPDAQTPSPPATASAGVTETEPSSGPTPDPSGAPAPPASADAELDAFRAALEGQSPLDPDALVAAVEAAGFERSAIERTREVDSLGAPVTFLEIAVRRGESCLIGQVGDGEPLALRTSALGGGRCLVGEIVTVD